MKMTGKVVFDGVLVLIFAVMVVMSFGYNSQARLVPLIIGIPSLVMSIVQLIADGFPSLQRKLSITQQRGVSAIGGYLHDHDEDRETLKEPTEYIKKAEIKRAVRVFGWLILLTILLGVVNYHIGIPIFIFLFMLLESRVKLLTSLLVAAGTEGFIYLLFGILLRVTF